jgi:hypothetical protein
MCDKDIKSLEELYKKHGNVEVKSDRFPDTLEEYMRQKGWNGERIYSEEVDWGGFVGEEVPW